MMYSISILFHSGQMNMGSAFDSMIPQIGMKDYRAILGHRAGDPCTNDQLGLLIEVQLHC